MRWVVHRCVSTPASPVVSHRPDHQQPEWVLRPFVEMGPVPHRRQDPPRVVGHAAVNDAADETLEDLSAAGGRCPDATSVRCGCAVMTPTAIHGAPREASAGEQPRSAQYARHRLGSAPSCRNLVEPDHLPFRRLALKDRRALHRGPLGCGEPEVASDRRRSFHRPCSLWANPSARRRRLNDVTNRWSSVFAGPTRNGPISARKRTDLGTEADRSRRVPHRRLHADHYCPTTAEVELTGLEPVTPCLQSRCATNCAIAPTNRPGR